MMTFDYVSGKRVPKVRVRVRVRVRVTRVRLPWLRLP